MTRTNFQIKTDFLFEYQNITMIAGNTVAFNVEIFDDEGNPVAVDSADFVCKKDVNGSETVFHKSLESGISQDSGMMYVRIAPEDTREAEAGRYFYAFQIGKGGDIFTLMTGVLSIEQNVVY